ncbi:uncharacterized protein TNCV_1544301 [Trichonephila clavipes]|nr:uncharacterized protein TNCV_1544301 [Trichonephila clavipes]
MSWTYRRAVTVPRINTRGDLVLKAMAPHTITPAVGAVCCFQFPRARHHSKRRRPWVGVKGSTRNGLHDPKCPSANHLCMVRKDTRAPREGATCAWMAADEAVDCTRTFLMMWRSSRRQVCRGRPEPDLRENDISRIHWSPNLLTTNKSCRIDELLA